MTSLEKKMNKYEQMSSVIFCENGSIKILIFEPKNLQTSEIFAGSVGRRAGGDY